MLKKGKVTGIKHLPPRGFTSAIIGVVVAVAAVACDDDPRFAAPPPPDDHERALIADYQVYYDEFVALARDSAFNLPDFTPEVRFVDIETSAHGRCWRESGLIEIDSIWWRRRRDDEARRNLVFHELGHCLLDLDHDFTAHHHGQCVSLMGGHTFGSEGTCSEDIYSGNWAAYYFSRLFPEGRAEPPFVDTYRPDLPVVSVDTFAFPPPREGFNAVTEWRNVSPHRGEATITQLVVDLTGASIDREMFTVKVSAPGFGLTVGGEGVFSQLNLLRRYELDNGISGTTALPLFLSGAADDWSVPPPKRITIAQDGEVTSVYLDDAILHTTDAIPPFAAGDEIRVGVDAGVDGLVVTAF